MKRLLISPIVAFGMLAMIARADEADKLRIKELEEKMAALEKEKSALTAEIVPKSTGLYDADGKVNPAVANAVLIIEGDKSVGTGFIVATEGRKYVYTAAHVFSGNSKLSIRNAAGTDFKKFGNLEAAEGADLVRLEVQEDVKDCLQVYPEDVDLRINTKIAALGNGGGNGVVSAEPGKILGSSGDSLEVDAGIIQGNSGGPVIEVSSGKAVGVVTHLSTARKDIWAEGTRQGEVRRFACRLNKEWKWKPMKIGTFLADGKNLQEFDEFTRLCFAMAQLQPLETGMRLDTSVGGGVTALQVIQKNQDNELVKSLIRMNGELAARKTSLSEADLKKRFRSLLAQAQAQAIRTSDAMKPQNFAWFHRNQAAESITARQQCLQILKQGLENLE